MKFVIVLMVSVMASYAYSRKSEDINFSGRDVPLTKLFSIIKSQTGVFFFYDVSLLAYARPVAIDWKHVTLETALNETFKNQPLTWVIEDKTVTIVKRNHICCSGYPIWNP